MNVLIIGLGSIGKKHISVLIELYPNANVFALRSKSSFNEIQNVTNVYALDELKIEISFAIIATPTFLHERDIINLMQLKCPLFIEKPVLKELINSSFIINLLKEKKIKTYIACNMRFHPGIVHLKKFITENKNKINEINVYFGSYMPKWRAGVNYKENYSSNEDMGGGVHLDLIHELDYCIWIFGYPKSIKSVFRKVSNLEINSIDYTNYILIYDNFTLNIKLNYYRVDTKREIEILTDNTTIIYNLITNKAIDINKNIVLYEENFLMLDTYRTQMKYFVDNIILNDNLIMNDIEESVKILKFALNDTFE